jgi:hypothetical protein
VSFALTRSYFFHFFSFFLFLVFFKQNIGGGILGKKVRMVELQQFESLGGLSVTFETLEVKVQTGGYFRG